MFEVSQFFHRHPSSTEIVGPVRSLFAGNARMNSFASHDMVRKKNKTLKIRSSQTVLMPAAAKGVAHGMLFTLPVIRSQRAQRLTAKRLSEVVHGANGEALRPQSSKKILPRLVIVFAARPDVGSTAHFNAPAIFVCIARVL
jgi:hypothetical protein